MANLLELKTKVRLEDSFTPPIYTRDEASRITDIELVYGSVTVHYTITYIGTETNIDTFTRTITDNP